jgi:hypothetical protein
MPMIALPLRAVCESAPLAAMFNRDKFHQVSKSMWGGFGQLIN